MKSRAQLHTAVAQDVVGRGAVEIKVEQYKMHEIWLAFETQRVFTKGQGDVPTLRAVYVKPRRGANCFGLLPTRSLRSVRAFFGAYPPKSLSK
jgi:hypothetical protein